MGGGCKVAENLLPQVLKVLYGRLSLTRGQIAIATELYVMEKVEARGSDVAEAVSNAVRELCADCRAAIEEGGLRVDVKCGAECNLEEVCPLPFYIAAYVRKATSRRVALASHEVRGAGECTIRYMLQ
ncbi:MAG: hypothetical protein QW753_00425 [Thermofilum sp.]